VGKYYFWDNVKLFCKLNKVIIWSICCVICLGILTGVFCVAKSSSEISLTLIQCYPLRNYFLNKMSAVGFLLLESFFVLICFLLLFLMSYLKCGKFLLILLSAYISFRLGVSIAVLVCVMGVTKGFIYAILAILIPCGFRIVLYMIFGFRMCEFNKQFCIFGNSAIRGAETKLTLCFYAICVVTVVIQTIILLIFDNLFVF
jgi:hypothetical protein